MKKINILFVGNLIVGGAELYLDRLIRTLDRQKFHVTVALLSRYGLKDDMPRDVDLIQVTDNPSSLRTAWKNWVIIFRLADMIRTRNIDIVHTNHLGINSLYAQIAAKILRLPTVETLQHAYNARSRTDDLFIKNSLAHAIRNRLVDRFVAMGEVLFKEVNTLWKIPVPKLFLNKMGVDIERFTPKGTDQRRQLLISIGVEPSCTVLGFIGSPRPVKGLSKVLMLMHHLKFHRHNIMLMVVGIESGHEDYEKQVRNLGIESHVIFCGLRTDMPYVISGMDWYIQATDGPSLGNTTLECMACGKPIATFYASAHEKNLASETCREGINGTLLNLNDVSSEAKRFAHLLQDEEQSHAMGRHSREIVKMEYSQSIHAIRMGQLYELLYKSKC